jgi:hypothetical protein
LDDAAKLGIENAPYDVTFERLFLHAIPYSSIPVIGLALFAVAFAQFVLYPKVMRELGYIDKKKKTS